ncbi:MAG: DUF2807 domain-containing protein [Bacteroidetes bacterium]|jgi:hypothetical protein|nr:DUF2807 domain-containing protein [Bacteroidota bacterium]MBT6686298.1 DUF2807 domain-containing protein [Bacteroidota bacterium]MBT7145100.1 DUF2807 domain-containing protein [Bacteroidota bacterium]MBT7490182.1 DUF2807 domain-containing protein [Bacteroidota bacterium]
MKIRILLISITLVSLFLPGCFINCIVGSGDVVSEERNVEAFNSIDLSGTANVYISKNRKNKVEIKTDDNILPLVETFVKNGKLFISNKNCISKTTVFDIYISMAEIEELNVSGSGQIHSEDKFKSNEIKLIVSGSGEILIDIKANFVKSRISGSGEIELKGNTDRQDVRISGSGEYNSFDLFSNIAIVDVSGSGNCEVNVEKSLEAEVSGSGDIEYKGEPKEVNTKVSGSGSIKKRN